MPTYIGTVASSPTTAYSLFDLTYMIAREMGTLEEGIATGGITTAIYDTNERTEQNDYWNGGSVWLLYDAGGGGAAPQGQYGYVSDFATTGGVITLRSALSIAPAAGDRYAIATKLVPLSQLISAVNSSIFALGPVPLTDITSITTADEQTEYSLPAPASHDLREVWIQNDNTDSNDNLWTIIRGWYMQHNATVGGVGTLILPYQPTSGYKLKLVYVDHHPNMYDYDDQLAEAIPIELIVYLGVVHCTNTLWRKTRRPEYQQDMARYEGLAALMRRDRPIKMPQRHVNAINLHNWSTDTSGPNKVHLG